VNIQKHKVLDLFSGIGGFSLGLERTGGFETVAFCEIDKKAQLVLKKHWSDVPIYEDIKELTHDRLRADGIFPTVLAAGFPCQDLSIASQNQKGLDGERSGLFFEITRLVREIRPDYCILENVPTLLANGNFSRVLGEFSQIGNYVVEWYSISAESMGAWHRRNRIWVIARNCGESANTNSEYERPRKEPKQSKGNTSGQRIGNLYNEIPNSMCEGLERHGEGLEEPCKVRTQKTACLLSGCRLSDFWAVEPDVGRVAHGIPKRVDRLKQLGNSLVPQIPEMIGRAILEKERIFHEHQRME
jgi:DNA (cytosine-5)-methyltransferase 1